LATSPLVVLVMYGGLVTVLCFAVHPFLPFLSNMAGAFTWVPARLIVAVAEQTATSRWFSSTTSTLSWSGTLVAYVLMIGGYVGWLRVSRPPRITSVSVTPADPI